VHAATTRAPVQSALPAPTRSSSARSRFLRSRVEQRRPDADSHLVTSVPARELFFLGTTILALLQLIGLVF
jgi:hypothetical protein